MVYDLHPVRKGEGRCWEKVSEHICVNSHNQSYFGNTRHQPAASRAVLPLPQGVGGAYRHMGARCSPPNSPSVRASLLPAPSAHSQPCSPAPWPVFQHPVFTGLILISLFLIMFFLLPMPTQTDSWQAGWKSPPQATPAFLGMSPTLPWSLLAPLHAGTGTPTVANCLLHIKPFWVLSAPKWLKQLCASIFCSMMAEEPKNLLCCWHSFLLLGQEKWCKVSMSYPRAVQECQRWAFGSCKVWAARWLPSLPQLHFRLQGVLHSWISSVLDDESPCPVRVPKPVTVRFCVLSCWKLMLHARWCG